MTQPLMISDLVNDFQKKFLMEKITKIKSTASKGKFTEATNFIKNLTTPWNNKDYAHRYVQNKLWIEVQQLWVMMKPTTAPHMFDNPYDQEEEAYDRDDREPSTKKRSALKSIT